MKKNNTAFFPDDPDKYIKTGQKKMMITMIVVIVITILLFCWVCVGYITISKKTLAFSEDNTLYVVIQDDMINSVGIGTKFEINGKEYTADFEPFELYHTYETKYEDEIRQLTWVPKLSKKDYLSNFGIKESPLPEGWYVATIKLQRCHPIKLLFE